MDHNPQTSTTNDLLELLRRIRKDATLIQAKVGDALALITELHLPEPDAAKCPNCGIHLRGPLALAEHVYVSHAGPLPEHYRRADELAGISTADA